MRGPYRLTEDEVSTRVETSKMGYYVLLSRSEVVRYVGRSDDDVRARLLDHAYAGKYYYFKFDYETSQKANFEHECNLYHDHYDTLDNKIHPDRPKGKDWQCPKCSIFKG